MASSIFGTQSQAIGMTQQNLLNATTATPNQSTQTIPQQGKVDQGTILKEISEALVANNNDMEKAFYYLADKKKIDPKPIVNEINSMTDPNAFVRDMLNNNPQISELITLLSAIKK